jgi:hypothetical protein
MCTVNHFPGFIVELFCISSRFFTRIIGFAFAQVIAASGSESALASSIGGHLAGTPSVVGGSASAIG